MRKILTIFIYSFFLFACAPNEPLDHLCQINNKTKKSDTRSDVKEISRDINLLLIMICIWTIILKKYIANIRK